MSADASGEKGGIQHPHRALHRRHLEAVLYLADKMGQADGQSVPSEIKIATTLAEAGGLKGYRQQQWYRDLSEDEACRRLDLDVAKRGALVVMALVLKADVQRKPEEQGYFKHVREKLGAPPVRVPVELEAHMALALEYFKGKD